jgi:hypothetical protein
MLTGIGSYLAIGIVGAAALFITVAAVGFGRVLMLSCGIERRRMSP